MINYSSYNDVWGISPDISNDNIKKVNDIDNIEKVNNTDNINYDNFTSSDSCENIKCEHIEHILNCDKCIEKLKKKLNLHENFNSKNISKETFVGEKKNNLILFNNKIKNILLSFCDNDIKKKFVLILLILLFIILSFYFVYGRGIDATSGEVEDIEALAEAVGSIDVNMKYIKENFIMIPKNMINFNNIMNPNL
tara:strand:+ start:7463 stop:8047 length:585 start_codon:yes stop_codon:yes gene_type:complete